MRMCVYVCAYRAAQVNSLNRICTNTFSRAHRVGQSFFRQVPQVTQMGERLYILRMAIRFRITPALFSLMQARDQGAATDSRSGEREAEAQRMLGTESAGVATYAAAAQGRVSPMGFTHGSATGCSCCIRVGWV